MNHNNSRWQHLLKPKILVKFVLLLSTCVFLPSCSTSFKAKHTLEETTLQQQLLQKINERDQVIADLQRRVQHLERQNNTTLATTETGQQMRTNAAPATVAVPTTAVAATPQQPQQPQQQKANTSRPAAGSFEVDEDAAQRALERTLVQSGALLLPFGQVEIQPFTTYTSLEIDTPAVFNLPNKLISADYNRQRRDIVEAGAKILIGLPFDTQAEIRIPGQFVAQSEIRPITTGNMEINSNASALGDISIGLAKTLMHERNWFPDVVARFTWNTPSGKYSQNNIPLGGGFNDFTGSLTFLKRQDPLAFTGSAAYQTTLEKNGVAPGDVLSFSVAATLAASPQTSLNFGLQQYFVQATKLNNISIPGSDSTNSMFTIGASSTIGRNLFFITQLGIGLTKSSPDYYFNVTIPFRFDLPFVQ